MIVYTVLARDLRSPRNVWVYATYDNLEAAKCCVKNEHQSIVELWIPNPDGTELLIC